jgi:leucyl-tRNA synthetase
VFDAGWPQWNSALVEDATIEIAVQVQGKTRGRVHVSPEATQEDVVAAAMADDTITRFVTGEPKKIIYVKGRLLSIVL